MAKILVVDDGEYVRLWVAQTLARVGHQVSTAEDGQRALNMLAAGECRPQLILLDINMPIMSGADFVVHSRGVAGAEVPIIVMTAEADPLASLPSDLRIATVLIKPFSTEVLTSTVARFTPLTAAS